VTTVPYVAQWASPELIPAILAGEISARDDPRWPESGAADAEQYEFWSWRCCGMACLRSVLLARGEDAPGIVALALETLAAGGYRLRHATAGEEDRPAAPARVDGLIYAPFAAYLAVRWEIGATVAAHLSTEELIRRVRQGGWVMASVHPSIRRPSVVPPGRGGHLVLVTGLAGGADGLDGDDGATSVVLHNPSGDSAANQADVAIAVDDFDRFFAGRGVLFPPTS
jgi:hypothetical protein